MRLLVMMTALIPAFLSPLSHAYVQTLTGGGAEIRWGGLPALNLVGNPINRNGISGSYFFTAVTRGLQRWQEASSGAISFDYWQGTGAEFEANSSYNGHSSIYFLSNSPGGSSDANVLGLTQVWYEVGSGRILETDILLNDRDHFISTQPSASSFLDNVLTHELGHAFGLSHNGGLQNTMLYVVALEQNHLSCDDWAGIRAVYGVGAGQTGGISGRLLTPQGAAIFGAQVVAISKARGTVLGSAMTDRAGGYVIRSLEPGEYFLLAEPYYAGASTLSEYYAGSSGAVCAGRNFSRTFLEAGDGLILDPVTVNPGSVRAVGDLRVKCENSGGAAVDSYAGTTLANAPVLSVGSGFGAVDRLRTGAHYYSLEGVSGRLEIHALSYSLYSPRRVQMRLLDRFGNEISSTFEGPVFRGESGFTNYDAQLEAQSLAPGSYILEVTPSSVSGGAYPAPQSLDAVPFLVLTGTLNAASPPLSGELPDNPRCRLPESFGAYVSPGGTPPRADTRLGREEKVGFCGTVRDVSGGGGSGPSTGALLGWLLPWLVMAMAARWPRIRLRFRFRAVTL